MKSLRGKLLLAIGLCLLLTQSISIIWVWHESQEQIELLVVKALASNTLNLNNIEKEIQSEIQETIVALILPAVLAIFASIILTFIAISRLTRPLSQLASEIKTRSPYNLQTLDIPNASSEIATVEHAINQLLYRLESGLAQERIFTADVAHELRTPLAGVRLNLELMQQKNIPQAGILIARIDQMIISIEQLLQLARAGQKLLNNHGHPIDLISEVITPMQMEWSDDPACALTWEVPQHAYIAADSGLIYLLLRNLLENIRRYAPNTEQATVRLTQHTDKVILEVLDQGPGVVAEKIPSLTDRFTRIDTTQKGYGLGLNIVNRIVQIHQGTLDIANRTDRSGLHITITFPAAHTHN